MSRICISLPGPDCQSNLSILQDYAGSYQAFELRLDLINDDLPGIVSFFDSVFGHIAADKPGFADLACEGDDFSIIITLRRKADGGAYDGSVADGEKRLVSVLALLEGRLSEFNNMIACDIERESHMPQAEELIRQTGIRRIRSAHLFEGIPTDPAALLEELSGDGAVAKLAAMPQGLQDLAALFAAGRNYAKAADQSAARADVNRRFILLGMGEYGMPSRILPEKSGSCITFASAGSAVAPGQLDAKTLTEEYRFAPIDVQTPIFAIVGKPVGHSRSPLFHNAKFREAGVDARYIPLLTDDVQHIAALAEHIALCGVSVTVPHKENFRSLLSDEKREVQFTGACNTAVRGEIGWEGTNTDVEGFLAPISNRLDSFGGKATVIGAGGAARAVVFGLMDRGFDVLVLNRSADRLADLVKAFEGRFSASIQAAALNETSSDLIRQYSALIVQTTSVGMHGSVQADPLDFYQYSGSEFAYDIIYTPEKTPFLQRAEAAGCEILNGWPMFLAQAEAQSRLFLTYC